MQRYTNSVVLRIDSNITGNADEGAQIKVYLADGVTPAVVFSDFEGTVLAQPFLTNSFVVDQSTNPGQFTFVADGGNYVISVNENLALQNRTSFKISIKNEINVIDFGAIGDGVTDDTAAIQAASNAITGTGVVSFPVGTYLTSKITRSHNVKFVGQGSGITTITSNSTVPEALMLITGADTGIEASAYGGNQGLSFRSNANNTDILYYNGRVDNNHIFDDLQFVGISSVTTNGINMEDYLNFNSSKIRFDKLGGDTIKIRDGSIFGDCHFYMDGFSWDNGTSGGTSGNTFINMDLSALNTSKGSIVLDGGRIEVNDDMNTVAGLKPALFYINNHVSQVAPQLTINMTGVGISASGKDMRIIGCSGTNGAAYDFSSVTSFGITELLNDDSNTLMNGAEILPGDSNIAKINTVSPRKITSSDLFDTEKDLSKFDFINFGVIGTEAGVTSSTFNIGDVAYWKTPANTAGKLGRRYAVKAESATEIWSVDMVQYSSVIPTRNFAAGARGGDKVLKTAPIREGIAPDRYVIIGWIFIEPLGAWKEMRTLTGD